MNASTIIFYILSAVITGGGLAAVLSGKLLRAAIFLLFSLLGVAGLYFYLEYEFIGSVQILVYVGGIVVLIIFSIFLTHQSGGKMERAAAGRVLISALLAIASCIITVAFIGQKEFAPGAAGYQPTAISPTVKTIGTQMLSTSQYGYVLPFEAVSVLLLAAMIGCIVIAIKIKPKA